MKPWKIAFINLLIVIVVIIIIGASTKHTVSTGTVERLWDERFDLPHGWFAFAHQYHGCYHSYWSEERYAWVFKRDGKECLLFTESLRNVILDRFNINEEQRQWLGEK